MQASAQRPDYNAIAQTMERELAAACSGCPNSPERCTTACPVYRARMRFAAIRGTAVTPSVHVA